MINKYIFFRTDRIGDFLLSAILIKGIKRSDNNAFITVVASKKNFSYIVNFDFIDEVILFPDSYFKKFVFYLRFFFKKFYLIGLLDGKKRSLYFSLLTRSKFKFLFTYKKFYKIFFNIFFTQIYFDQDFNNKISEIKNMLSSINYDLNKEDFKTINKSLVSSRNLNIPSSKNYTLLHLDEKWIFNDYIQSYKSIEPSSEVLLVNFLDQLIQKTKNDVCVSTGNLPNKFSNYFKKNFVKNKNNHYEHKISGKVIYFYDNLTFLELEKLILFSNLIISCHGAATHVAASFNIKIIDIIDHSEEVFFTKWTAHFNKYQKLKRNEFIQLSKNIIELI